ncbi:MAG: cysteine--tRNA ligase [Parvularculales bacterium]
MVLRIHNTVGRKKEAFKPLNPAQVTIYVCGPTVYAPPHIGNARPAVVFDVLVRLLRHLYPDVLYVRNITDVEDKILAAAKAENKPFTDITTRYTALYHDNLISLGVLPPDVEPIVTQSMDEIIEMIADLVHKAYAYVAESHVLFHVPSHEAYGTLSGRNREQMIDGARVEVAPYKRDAADFVLWKPSGDDETGWDSPWGRGRPGWHIECSAMIARHLGPTIDIHGGGLDLAFPHHENELAQSQCAHEGAPLARYWMHNGMVTMQSEKMSKSEGNIILVQDLLAKAPGEAVRYALLSGHYRQPLDWSDDLLQQSRRSLDRLYRALRGMEKSGRADPPSGFMGALQDDLNTPQALAALFGLARSCQDAEGAARQNMQAQLRSAGELLGLLQDKPENWFGEGVHEADDRGGDEIDQLVAARSQARTAGDFAKADEIRRQLEARGIIIEDGPSGSRWHRAH